jgi:hypothetical protein
VNASSWKSPADVDKWAAKDEWLVHSVGFLLRETPDYYVLANSWTLDEQYYSGLIKIPRAWAAKIVLLTKGDQTDETQER